MEPKDLTVGRLFEALEGRIPRALSCDWDNDGLSCCPDLEARVTGALVALDATDDAIRAAEELGYNVVLTHHPLLFRGLRSVDGAGPASARVIRLIRSGIAAMAFHTRLDEVDGGVNDALAALLGLAGCRPFGEDGDGQRGPFGRIGALPAPLAPEAFADAVRTALRAPAVLFASGGRPVSTVAVVSGSGGDLLDAAVRSGADAFVTGEIGYHPLCDAPYRGVSVVAAGHYHTEFPVCARLAAMVSEICPGCPVRVYDSTRIEVR